MFDFLRDLGKSEEEKRQEALSAYLDDALTPREKERFEQHLAADETLRASLEEQRLIRATMRRLPRINAPRSFTLDPELYGRPQPSTSGALYPVLRAATGVVAILFVVVLVLDFVSFDTAGRESEQSLAVSTELSAQDREAAAPAEAPVELEAGEEFVAGSAVEVTRVVEEAEEALETAAEMPAAEMPAEEEAAEAEIQAEEIVADEMEAAVAPEDAGAPAGERLPAAPGADTGAQRDGDAPPQPPATMDGRPLAEPLRSTATAFADLALAEETPPSPPTPSRAARDATTAQDDAADVAKVEAGEAIDSEAEPGLSTFRIVALILGLSFVALALATLAVRRSQQS